MILLLGSALRELSRIRFAAIAFGALGLAACQSTAFAPDPSGLGARSESLSNPATSGSTRTYNWLPYTTTYGANTLLTGISDNGHTTGNLMYITGNSYTTKGSYFSFATTVQNETKSNPAPGPPVPEPPTSTHPNVYLNAPSSVTFKPLVYSAGYAPGSSGSNCPTPSTVACGFIYDPKPPYNEPTEAYLRAPKDGSSKSCGGTYLSGTMGANIQVGYYYAQYSGGQCGAHAVEEYRESTGGGSIGPKWTDFQLPSSLLTSVGSHGTITNSWAYGINDYGDVVGAFTTSDLKVGSNPLVIGWKFKAFNYTAIQYNNTAVSTVLQDIGFDQTLVGWYIDSSTGKMHGFQYHGGWSAQDFPKSSETVVYGYNDEEYMVGAYRIDNSSGAGVWKGFLAQCHTNC